MRSSSERRPSLAVAPAEGRVALLDRILQWGVVALLAWAPLPFGSARPWAWSLLGVLVAALLIVAALRELLGAGSNALLIQLRWPILMAALLVGWILLQSLPGMGPEWHHPLWDKAAEALGKAVRPSISVDREASLVHLFRLLAYAAVFFLAWQVGQRAKGAALLVRAVAAIGAAYALYGLAEFATPNPAILWFRKWAYVDDLTSTFVNKNSFATFAGLSVIAALVLIAQLLIREGDTRSRTTLVVSTLENILWRGVLPVTGCLLAASALLLSHSRGGMLATLCGVFTFAVLATTAPSQRSAWRVPFGWFIGVAGVVVILIAGAGVVQRLAENSIEEDGRVDIFAGTLAAIHDNLLTGTGLGSFRFIFPMYQSPRLDAVVDLAHSDYLENILELGLPAALLLFALVGFLVFQCFLGVRRRHRDALYPCAAAAASVLVGVHACIDFSLQIPAVAVTYAALLGVGVAQSVSSRRREER